MKVLWLGINASYAHSSLALPLLHLAAGDRAETDWQALQATVNDDVHAVAIDITRHHPDVLAATVTLFNRHAVLETARCVKALLPACQIVLGGPEFLGDNTHFLRREPYVDAVFRGEGEPGFAPWLSSRTDQAKWVHIPGLCWLDAHGRCHDNDMAIDQDLAARPGPSESPLFDWSKPFVQLETSRGCPSRCTFCTSCRMGRLRIFPIQRVAAELERFQFHGVREVRVVDRTFNATTARCVELLQLFRRTCPHVRFHLEFSPLPIPPELRAELIAAPAGHLHLEIGLQTTDPYALSAVRRTGNPAAALDSISYLCGLSHIETHVDLLAGLPCQTLDHVIADLAQLTEIGPDEIQLEILKVLPGTPLRDHATELDIVFAPTPPYDILQTPTFSADELLTARSLSRVVDGYYNHPALRSTLRIAARSTTTLYMDLGQALRQRPGRAGVMPSLTNRFRSLHEIVASTDPKAREQLEYDWMRHGLSPTHGICRATVWKTGIPADAQLREGRLGKVSSAQTRTWHHRCATHEYWFIYPRTGGDATPQAIYSRPVT